MNRFRALKAQHPDYAAAIFDQGRAMVVLAQRGALEELQDLVSRSREVREPPTSTRARASAPLTPELRAPQDELLHWFNVRMFRSAALELHVHVLRYMVRQGFAVAMPALRGISYEVVARCVSAAAPCLAAPPTRAGTPCRLRVPVARPRTCRSPLPRHPRARTPLSRWRNLAPPPSAPSAPAPCSRSSSTTTPTWTPR